MAGETPTKKDRRPAVVVSSATQGLTVHREKAGGAVERRGMFPLMMERSTAEDTQAVDYSLDLVDQAEVYVGIFGRCYGSFAKGYDISYTELEYRRAVELELPRLIFIMHQEHPILAGESEDDPDKIPKRDALHEELKEERVVGFFRSSDDLHGQIFQALTKLIEDGVVGSKPQIHSPSVSAIPRPPEPYTAHPYIMPRAFFGRKAELEVLDAWASSPGVMFIFEAIGGVGKSALTWHWLCQEGRVERSIPDLAGAIWWSFYETDADVSNFLRRALAYVTGQPVEAFNPLSREDREAALLSYLCERPYLIVFDGIERILAAYHRMDAPHLTDDDIEQEVCEDDSVRRCIDPRDGAFLCKLAGCTPSKVLVTSRLMPRDLEDPDTRKPLPGVRWMRVGGLDPYDAIDLMRYLGVEGGDGDLDAFMRQFDYHGLLLGAIAGRIIHYRPAPGDFGAWYRAEGRGLGLEDLDPSGRRTGIMAYALDGLSDDLRLLLSQVAAFRYPVDYEALRALNPYAPEGVEAPKRAPDDVMMRLHKGWLDDMHRHLDKAKTEEEADDLRDRIEKQVVEVANQETAYVEQVAAWEAHQAALVAFHAGLDALEDRGLLRWDRGPNRYDLHPVVRGYAFRQFDEAARRATHDRIHDYFSATPPEDLDEVKELGDLRRTLEMYYALVGAGRLDDAARLYRDRLEEVLHFQIAAYHAIVAALTPLFPEGAGALPTLASYELQSAIVTGLGSAFYYLGRNAEALALEALKLKLDLGQRYAPNLGVGLRNYALSLQSKGWLAAANRAYELARELALAAGDRRGLAMSHLKLLGIYRDTGRWAEAEAAYAAFCDAPPLDRPAFWQADAEKYRAEMLLYRGKDAAAALDRAWALSVESKHALGQRQIHQLRGEAALLAGDADAAAAHFEEAIAMARQSGSDEGVSWLGGLARARGAQSVSCAAQGRADEARRLVKESGRYIDAAEVYLTLGDVEQARDYALAAYRWAWADGPPYVWWWSLERAKRVLAALDEPEPEMPPFDPDAVEPLPYEDEIRAFIEELAAGRAGEADSPDDDADAGWLSRLDDGP